MEKNHKDHKKSSYTVSLGDSKKSKHCNNDCGNSSSDDECKKKSCSKKKCKKCVGPPGPLVVTVMATGEPNGLEPGPDNTGTYCIIYDCNTKYLSVGCYITIVCTSIDTAYFLIKNIVIDDTGIVISIENVNEETATWEVGAKVALVGPMGQTGATGATLFDVAPIAEVSWPYGATLITGVSGLISLQLAPADNANPGLLTASQQLIAGTKYFQDVFVAANFNGNPFSPWGGFDPGSMYFDTGLNALQVYLGSTVGSTFRGTTWCSVLTDCSGYTGGLNGVTALGATGLSYGATLTSDRYLQFGSANSTNPGIVSTTGQTFSGNKYFTGLIGVGNYSSAPYVGITGSIYFNTTISGASGLQLSNGSSWSSVKSFVIDHPKNQEKLLVHGCLEGPEAGVYYRGKGLITNNESVVIELPDYVDKLATNLTVQLTPIYDGNIYKPQYFSSEVAGNKFEVHGVNGAFYWTVYGQRISFIVEPNKKEVEIKGDGPYKWL
uniref:Uncharacterized protein n=1 Tax=viral metagenome TaxID=1070528 RepID=A0A6C0H9Q9_9ZZZZ